MWVLRNEPRSSGKVLSVLNHGVITPAPAFAFFRQGLNSVLRLALVCVAEASPEHVAMLLFLHPKC